MDQEIVAPVDRAFANLALASASNIDTQPPRASLLGLPKELLNYIIILAIDEDPDTDPTALLMAQRNNKGLRQDGRVNAFPSPALARTCTTLEAIVLPIYYGQRTFHFCSMNLAVEWLNQERRMKSVASVRQVRVHFGVPFKLKKKSNWKRKSLDMFLETNSQVLALSKESRFYTELCEDCQRESLAKVQRINDLDSQFHSGEDKLAILSRIFDRRIGSRTCGRLWCDSRG